MRLNTLLLIAGLLALGFGLSFLLVPGIVLPIYGLDPAPATVLMSRFFGAALVQLGTTLYLVREVHQPDARRALALAGIVGSAAGMAVALMGQLAGLVNAMGWSTVAIYALLLFGYAVQLRERPATA
jgi:hypothetical protein